MDLAGKRVVVMGLGRFGGGLGVTRFLHRQGADVLVTDLQPPEALAASLKALEGLAIEYRLGEHNVADFTTADLVVVNPAVKPADNRFIRAAKAAGVALTSEIRLLVSQLPSHQHTIGITGTAGKSTVTAMIGQLLAAAHGGEHVHVGGNLGGSLLGNLQAIGAQDWVVLELSSFMLEGLDEDQWAPHIAVVTNFADNHLDWHGDTNAYRQAKQAILRHQAAGDVAVLGPDVREWRAMGRVIEPRMDDVPALRVPGEHNRLNAALAMAAAEAAVGAKVDRVALTAFAGLPHRLQFVCVHDGVRYFNDSKSTTPQAALLALKSFVAGKVHILLGGYDKGSDLSELARTAAISAKGIYTFGATGESIAQAAQAHGGHAQVVPCGTLDQAVLQAVRRTSSGDVVLLSPACASWDQFENFEQRGSQFVQAVLRYTTEAR
jgi:UDP-N-acetylmuramoylalanine--D-glutamate ligase